MGGWATRLLSCFLRIFRDATKRSVCVNKGSLWSVELRLVEAHSTNLQPLSYLYVYIPHLDCLGSALKEQPSCSILSSTSIQTPLIPISSTLAYGSLPEEETTSNTIPSTIFTIPRRRSTTTPTRPSSSSNKLKQHYGHTINKHSVSYEKDSKEATVKTWGCIFVSC